MERRKAEFPELAEPITWFRDQDSHKVAKVLLQFLQQCVLTSADVSARISNWQVCKQLFLTSLVGCYFGAEVQHGAGDL